MARETFQFCSPMTRDKKIIRGIVAIKNPRWGKAKANKNNAPRRGDKFKPFEEAAAGPVLFSPRKRAERINRTTDRTSIKTPTNKGRKPGPGF